MLVVLGFNIDSCLLNVLNTFVFNRFTLARMCVCVFQFVTKCTWTYLCFVDKDLLWCLDFNQPVIDMCTYFCFWWLRAFSYVFISIYQSLMCVVQFVTKCTWNILMFLIVKDHDVLISTCLSIIALFYPFDIMKCLIMFNA